MGDKVRATQGDVVQICPESNPVFGGCMLIVEEVKTWGVKGYVAIPASPLPQSAYLRVKHDDYEVVGVPTWVVSDG